MNKVAPLRPASHHLAAALFALNEAFMMAAWSPEQMDAYGRAVQAIRELGPAQPPQIAGDVFRMQA